MSANRLLAIDDDFTICELIKDVAENAGYQVAITSDPGEFRDIFASFDPTVIALDLQMPGSDGVELLRYLADAHCRAGILIVSGVDGKVMETAGRLGAAHGLDMIGTQQKPLRVAVLEELLKNSLQAGSAITEQTLSAAISSGEITVHYQPKVRLAKNRRWLIAAVEALVRWDHPKLGMIMPDAFISLAEDTGLIAPLTERVLRIAIEQVKRWQDEGLPLSVAVNLSPKLLDDLGLPDQLSRLVHENGLTSSRIVVEITESGIMSDAARAMDILTRLRIKGFRLSIDDFGTGYSSLVQLYRMPFNEVKIDRSFIHEATRNPEAEAIVTSIVGLARNLGLSTCAEGVEDWETMNFLHTLECDMAQGYLISRPLIAADVVPFSRRWNKEDA